MKQYDEINFIAEVSANHLGRFERAKQIVVAAATAGATSIKLQTYTAETMTLNNPNLSISDNHKLWGGKNLFQLYREAHTPWEWHGELFELARSLGLTPFSSPFDESAITFLESIDCPVYKIASMETGDHLLIRAAALTGKPLIISTGATEIEEIRSAVRVAKEAGNSDLTLLVCTSSYPADPKESHVRRIQTLRDEFECKVGLSDHTLGVGVSIAAIALGASAIEKHLTLKRTDGGADGAFSMEPDEFALLVKEGKNAKDALGNPDWEIQPSEAESRRLRRSLYITRDVTRDEIVNTTNVKSLRPSGGAAPSNMELIIGMKFNSEYKSGTPFQMNMVE